MGSFFQANLEVRTAAMLLKGVGHPVTLPLNKQRAFLSLWSNSGPNQGRSLGGTHIGHGY